MTPHERFLSADQRPLAVTNSLNVHGLELGYERDWISEDTGNQVGHHTIVVKV